MQSVEGPTFLKERGMSSRITPEWLIETRGLCERATVNWEWASARLPKALDEIESLNKDNWRLAELVSSHALDIGERDQRLERQTKRIAKLEAVLRAVREASTWGAIDRALDEDDDGGEVF